MRGNNGIKFFLVIAVIAALTYIAAAGNFFGIRIPGANDIRPGIDINGGIDATLYAISEDGKKPTQDDLDTAKLIINKRLDKLGILDREVAPDVTNGRIILRIPWKPGEKEYDPDKAIKEIGKTTMLRFREVKEGDVDKNGDPLPTGDIIIQGTDVLDAKPVPDQQTGGTVVQLELSSDAKKKFAEATARLVGKPIAIFMDDDFISAPVVEEPIPNGDARITLGGRDFEAQKAEAKELAETIRSGGLPFKLEAKRVDSISPTLGKGALKVSVEAGVLAFFLVCLFMILYYRLPGILACIALLGHTVIQLLAISWLEITVTLPGLAGIILTIGMGVDANVIIFERIKEELRSGKTLRASIDVGFKRAFSAILDANVTTLISAVVLFIFGTGPMVSFAYTLGLGVLLSFLTAVTVSRIMVRSVADLDIAKHPWLYGVKSAKKEVQA